MRIESYLKKQTSIINQRKSTQTYNLKQIAKHTLRISSKSFKSIEYVAQRSTIWQLRLEGLANLAAGGAYEFGQVYAPCRKAGQVSWQSFRTKQWQLINEYWQARTAQCLSAYRHKNLANRTVIDLMVFLFKKKKEKRKWAKNKQKEKRNKRNFLLKGTLTCTIYALRHTLTQHTRVSLWPRKGQDQTQTQTQPQPQPEPESMCAPQSRPLNCKSSQMKNAPMKTQTKMANGFFFPFCFWRAGLGLGAWTWPYAASGRGWTINKRLTSIDFAAGKRETGECVYLPFVWLLPPS